MTNADPVTVFLAHDGVHWHWLGVRDDAARAEPAEPDPHALEHEELRWSRVCRRWAVKR